MDSRSTRGPGGINQNYVLAGIVVVLIVILAFFLTQKPTSPTTTLPISTGSAPTTIINGQTTIPGQSSLPTTIANISYTPVGALYCFGGVNQTAVTNLSAYAKLYNQTYYNASQTVYWLPSTSYPLDVEYPSCAQSGNFAYCVGGQAQIGNFTVATSSVYSVHLGLNGTSNWTKTVSYPTPIAEASCVTSNGYIYCTGGQSNSTSTNSSYYSSLNSSNIVKWQSTTAYPLNVTANSCTSYDSYIYCVGGAHNFTATNASYYAPLSSSGIGKWAKSTNYPIGVVSSRCIASSTGDIYCIGNNPNFASPYTAYYAQVSSSGIGKWARTTNYPSTTPEASACVAQASIVYCTGALDTLGNLYGFGYYSQLTPYGLSNWTSLYPYPTSISAQSCVST